MFGLGIGELLVILVIVLVIFGAGKLPEIGDGLGRGIRSFRKAVRQPDEIDITPKSAGEEARHDSAAGPGAESKKSDEGGTQA
jgi:sec-independent protein translocase protein TatA